MDVDLTQDWEATTAAAVKEASEADLIPTGTYEGLVTGAKARVVDKDTSPFYGVRMARVQVDLFGVGPEGKTKKYWFDATPTVVRKDDGTFRAESKHAAALAKLTGSVGQPFGATLEAAMSQRLRYRVRLSEETPQYEARNFLDAITAVR